MTIGAFDGRERVERMRKGAKRREFESNIAVNGLRVA